MSFGSYGFLFFFLLVWGVCRNLSNLGAQRWVLLAASLAFYMSWNVPCVLLLLFTSLLDFNVARQMGQTADPVARRRWLWVSLAGNLGILGFFKYSNFILDNVRALAGAAGVALQARHFEIILPPAISYFTFASMSYVLDVYFERLGPCQSARDYTLFVSFFPKLLSGPIVRAVDFLPQLANGARPGWDEVEAGLSQFLLGAVKKMVLADQLAENVNQIFSTPRQFDRFTLVQGLLGYTAQLYCDFSGYSDMAIGCGRILGFRFAENFQMPFSSVNIAEFWRRWHITMSTWFRDYLFLPLEIATRSNPLPLLRMSLNMLATMLLCGLWHGSSWNYVIWGGIHGAALATHKIWTTCKPERPWLDGPVARLAGNILSRILTLGVVILALIFFRTETLAGAMAYFGGLFSLGHEGQRLVSIYIFPVVAIIFLTHLLVNKDRNVAAELRERAIGVRIAVYTGLLLALVCLEARSAPAFIYFKY